MKEEGGWVEAQLPMCLDFPAHPISLAYSGHVATEPFAKRSRDKLWSLLKEAEIHLITIVTIVSHDGCCILLA